MTRLALALGEPTSGNSSLHATGSVGRVEPTRADCTVQWAKQALSCWMHILYSSTRFKQMAEDHEMTEGRSKEENIMGDGNFPNKLIRVQMIKNFPISKSLSNVPNAFAKG